MPVSGRVFRLDFVPVSFSSFPFLREGIILLRSRQDGVAGTVTKNHVVPGKCGPIGQLLRRQSVVAMNNAD